MPNPWHLHYCPLHAAAPELVEALGPAAALIAWFREGVIKGEIQVSQSFVALKPHADWDVLQDARRALARAERKEP